MIFDFATEKYGHIIATVITLFIFFFLKRFSDSLVKRFGIKSDFPKVRIQLVKKYIDFLLWGLLFVVVVSI